MIRVVREALVSQDETISLSHKLGGYQPEMLGQTVRFLSFAVVKVWAQMIKMCNSPWPMVILVGQSLDQYAKLMHESLSIEVEGSAVESNP